MNNQQDMLFKVIGSPFFNKDKITLPTPEEVDDVFDFSFENRVALLFLQRYAELGGVLSDVGKHNLEKLQNRRRDTDAILVKVTDILNQKYSDEWVFFKTLKPFPSTPNDTDWFPFDVSKHKEMCQHMLDNGFTFLEEAPLQTTLIDDSGVGIADSDKRGGVWYIDCYKEPGADYFIYLDPKKMRKHLYYENVGDKNLPNLKAAAELSAICFHNVFPERTYSIETFYLVLHYLSVIESTDDKENFIATVKENHIERAVSANLAITQALHEEYFGCKAEFLGSVLDEFPEEINEGDNYRESGNLPYNFSKSCFWRCFFQKLKDPISFRSLFVQFYHMLNPVFLWGVIKILKQRMSKGGTYKQM